MQNLQGFGISWAGTFLAGGLNLSNANSFLVFIATLASIILTIFLIMKAKADKALTLERLRQLKLKGKS